MFKPPNWDRPSRPKTLQWETDRDFLLLQTPVRREGRAGEPNVDRVRPLERCVPQAEFSYHQALRWDSQ